MLRRNGFQMRPNGMRENEEGDAMSLSIFIKIWWWVTLMSAVLSVLVLGESLSWEKDQRRE